MKLKNYVVAQSSGEVLQLLKKSRSNVILGGLHWKKQSKKTYNTGIDISQLGLENIIETDEYVEIGAAVTLRELETNILIKGLADGIIAESVKNIVGIQFRNTATIGGSIFSKFGFSDLVTSFLSLETSLLFEEEGEISLSEFLRKENTRDLLKYIRIKKENINASYSSMRKTATDFPVINVCISKVIIGNENTFKIVVGARPFTGKIALEASKLLANCYSKENSKGSLIDDASIEEVCDKVIEELDFYSNVNSSKEYREHLTKVYVKRGINKLCK